MRKSTVTFLFIVFGAGLLPLPALADSDIRVIDPWVNAPRPGTKVTGAFLTLQNDGATDDALVGVSSPSANVVEIHKTTESNGMMRMEKIEELPILAGQKVAMQPGGYHVMLIGMRETDEVKRKWVTLILKFKKSGEMEFKAPVRAMSNQASGATSEKTSKQ